jgi:prepilin-type processing-associated H-X9-DG protein
LFGEAYHRDPLWLTFSNQCIAPPTNSLDLSAKAAWVWDDTVARNASVPINFMLTPSQVAGPFPGAYSPPCRDVQYKRLGAYGSGHGGGANVVMVDGSVRFLRDSLSLTTLQALSTRAGEEVITEDY